jgi:hypothetical protein
MKTFKLFRIAFVFLAIGLVFSSALSALAATVTLRVGSVQAQAGSTGEVPIEAVGAPGFGALHMELVYDSKVLTPDTVSSGTLAGKNALLDFNPATPGRILIGLITTDPIKGDGPLASVRFKVAGAEGTSSALTLEKCQAWENITLAEVLVKTEAGKATIVGGLPFWLLPLLIALVAMFLLFLLFLLFLRRRRAQPQPAAVQPVYSAPPPPVAAPRPMMRAPPPPMNVPESKAAAATAQTGDGFKKAEDEYFRLKGRLAAGRITREEFDAALKDLMTQDAQGRYWMLGADSGKWYVHDGQSWLEGQPY